MSDPFDFLNPIPSTKTPAEKVLGHAPHAPMTVAAAPVLPMMGMSSFQGNMGMSAPHAMGMNMNMNVPPAYYGTGINTGGMAPMGPGPFLGTPAMGMNMNQPMNPFGPNPTSQQAPMYDNIKKLLEKKPVVDETSMDFLEGLGSTSKSLNNPISNAVHQTPAEFDLNYLSGGAPVSVPSSQPAPSVSGSKSSALSSRLANGKRPTQEAARKNLGFNAGAFANSSHSAKISLKSVGGAPTAGEPTVDDFIAGNTSLIPSEDILAPTPTSSSTTTNDIFW